MPQINRIYWKLDEKDIDQVVVLGPPGPTIVRVELKEENCYIDLPLMVVEKAALHLLAHKMNKG